MPKIDPKTSIHELNTIEGAIPMKQKRRNSGTERQKAPQEVVQKLLAVDFIQEIRFPEWL